MLRKIFMVISIIVACQSQTIDPDLLREIFNTNFENITVTPTTGPSTYTQDDGSSCICVPYYLCDPDTNTTFTDGSLDGFGKIDIRFKPESCQESLEVCCKEPRDSSNPIIPEEKPERLRGCGVRNDKGVDFQISGSSGREAEFGEFPWTVAFLYTSNGSSFCGGALIHPQVVLTGSHCVNKRRPADFKIRAGEWDTQTTKERLPHQERNVRKIITHPQFHSQTLANNVALVILSEPVTLADNINTDSHGAVPIETAWNSFRDAVMESARSSVGYKSKKRPIWMSDGSWSLIEDRQKAKTLRDSEKDPQKLAALVSEYRELSRKVCLPEQDQNFDAAKSCFATGWGKDYFGKAGRYAVIMKKVQLDAVDYATCQRQLQMTRLGSRFKLHRSFLCAGGQKGKDTCEGDGGAPLVCPSYSPGRYYQAGIVSWGVGCGSENVPAAYTYVSKYRTWIDGNMQTEGFDPSSYVLVD